MPTAQPPIAPTLADSPVDSNMQSRLVRIETKLDGLTGAVERFVGETHQRFQQVDVETHQRFQQIESRQAQSGKLSSSLLTVIVTSAGLILAGLTGLIVLYVAPVKTAQEGEETRFSAAMVGVEVNQRRQEEDRRRDEDKFDERLQREMRLLNDTVTTSASATKEMLSARLDVDEKRMDDVTYRVDRSADEYRERFHDILIAPYEQKLK